MSDLLALARPEIVALQPYSHAQWRPELIRLHANEAPWRPGGDISTAGLNRYPEPQPAALMQRLAELFAVRNEQLLVTRGSDEAIDLLSRIFLRAGQDAILQCTPTFGMYQVAARIQGGEVINLPLQRAHGWRLDAQRIIDAWQPRIKLVYLCSPNNPTGNQLDPGAILAVCKALDGKAVIVLDEAYIEWAGEPRGSGSFAHRLDDFATLAILRTLSKAHALAGARCGALLGGPELIALAARVIPPYAIAQPCIEAIMRALTPSEVQASRQRLAMLCTEREYLAQGLARSPLIEKVWPSDTNFLMLDCREAHAVMSRSRAAGFIIRDLSANPALATSLRVTVGEREHNDRLLAGLGVRL